jgi:hypothetical protein
MSASLSNTARGAAGYLAAVALATVLAGGPRIWVGVPACLGPLAVVAAERGPTLSSACTQTRRYGSTSR